MTRAKARTPHQIVASHAHLARSDWTQMRQSVCRVVKILSKTRKANRFASQKHPAAQANMIPVTEKAGPLTGVEIALLHTSDSFRMKLYALHASRENIKMIQGSTTVTN